MKKNPKQRFDVDPILKRISQHIPGKRQGRAQGDRLVLHAGLAGAVPPRLRLRSGGGGSRQG